MPLPEPTNVLSKSPRLIAGFTLPEANASHEEIREYLLWPNAGQRPLIDENSLRTAERKFAEALNPCGESAAIEFVRGLFCLYPDQPLADLEIYLRGLTTLFQEYAAPVAIKAVDTLSRSRKRLPSRAHCFEALEQAAKPDRDALAAARAQLDAHERKRIAAIDREKKARQLAWRHQLREAHDRYEKDCIARGERPKRFWEWEMAQTELTRPDGLTDD